MDWKDKIYNFLKENPRTCFTYLQLSKKFETHESHLSKHLNKMLKIPYIYPGLKHAMIEEKFPHRDTYKPLESQTKKVRVFFYLKE